eukprot:gene4658-4911_t
MATAKEVQTALRQLLPTLDMNETTERKIREQLAEELGSVEEHRKLIKAEIDDFLTQTIQAEAEQTAAGIQLDTQGLKFASISSFKGSVKVNIRNFYRNDDGQVLPTKKGITFSPEEWAAVQKELPGLTAALQDGDDAFSVDLGIGNIKLQTSKYQ